jgi:DNA-binding response OmpR family regulator
MAQSSPQNQNRALIVEDETMVALGLEADMHELGFNTCMAANGRQAFRYAMTQRPDVALMDINLEGGREGIEVARRLRDLCDVPIVFVTGYTDTDTVKRVRERSTGSAGAAEAGLS